MRHLKTTLLIIAATSLLFLSACGDSDKKDSVELNVNPNVMGFSWTVGEAPPPPKIITINGDKSGLNFSASTNDNWISVSPTSGATNAKISVSINTSALAVGSYDGTVTIAPTNGKTGARTVNVSCSVFPQGVKVEFPDDLLWWDPTLPKYPKIAVTVSQTPPQGAPDLPQYGDFYNFSKDIPNNFLQPITVTIPYDSSKIESPGVLYWNDAKSRYESAAITRIDSEKESISFQTVHFSTFVVVGTSDDSQLTSVRTTALTSIDTGFDPSVDGFYSPNFGNFKAPGGSSWGMTNFALYYFRDEKASDNNGLYQQQKGLHNKYRDDSNIEKWLISQLQNALNPIWVNRWDDDNHLNQVDVGYALINNMKITNHPQLLILRGYDFDNNLKQAQSVLVYKFMPDGSNPSVGVFYVYDPNSPAETVTLTWNSTASDRMQAFSNYSKASTYSYPFTDFVFDAQTAAGKATDFGPVFQNAENAVNSASLLGAISVTSPVLDKNNVVNIELTGEDIPDVTVTGSVSPLTGQTMPNYIAYMVNGDATYMANLSGNGAFTITLPGEYLLASGNVITLRATSSIYNTWNVAAFTSFILNFSGQTVTSFVNIGFEDSPTNWDPWIVETHHWDNNVRDTTGSPFEYVSTSAQACIDSGRLAVFCNRTDRNGRYYATAATGTLNPNYNPYWGLVNSFTQTDTYAGKSELVADTEMSSSNTSPQYTSQTPGRDPIMDYYLQNTDFNTTGMLTLNMVFEGNRALRINNGDNSYHTSSVMQTATIPSLANPVLKFAWAAVLEDPSHSIEDQPFVEVAVIDETLGIYIFREQYISGNPAFTGWQRLVKTNGATVSPTDSPWNVIPWQTMTIDVSSAIGHDVTIWVTASDCGLSAHGGYAYLDASP